MGTYLDCSWSISTALPIYWINHSADQGGNS